MNRVKRKWWIGLAAVMALVLVLALAFWPAEKEPEYQGKKLSWWLAVRNERPQESAQAIRSIGTNGVPLLTKWVEFELPLWRLGLLRIYDRFPGALRNNRIGFWVTDWDSQIRAINAVYGFEVLGGQAHSAAPELARFIADRGKVDCSRAALALAYAGEQEALVPLLSALGDRSRPAIRRTSFAVAIIRVKYRGPELKQAIPVLILCVQETNQFVPSLAASALGTFAIDAEVCVPVLSNATHSADSRLRRNSVRALGEFGSAAGSAVDVVSNAMSDSDPNVRKEATNASQKITMAVKTDRIREGHE